MEVHLAENQSDKENREQISVDLVVDGGMALTMVEDQDPVMDSRILISNGRIVAVGKNRPGNSRWPVLPNH